MSTANTLPVEKLRGRENYVSWKFAAKAWLSLDDLWDVVDGSLPIDPDQADIVNKNRKALSKIILIVDPIVFPHIESAMTAKEAWDNLKTAYEDTGLTRKVGLLKQLITTRLENCDSVEEYVNKIISTAQRLREIDFKVGEEWVGTILLAGLPNEYKPMIMGLESSGINITDDTVKVKILQEVKASKHPKNTSGDSVLYSRSRRSKHQIECFSCHKRGHFASQCQSKHSNSSANNSRDKKSDNKSGSNSKGKAFFSFLSNNGTERSEWYLDSCASNHLTNDKTILEDVSPNSKLKITTIDGTKLSSEVVGKSTIPIVVDGKADKVIAHSVNYVPGTSANLLSVSKVTGKGHTVIFRKNGGEVIDFRGNIIATTSLSNGIYKLDTNTVHEKFTPIYFTEEEKLLTHRRLGHLSRKGMNTLKSMSTGLGNFDVSEKPCEVCLMGKHARLPFKPSKTRAANILDLLHMDVCGPMENTSLGDSRYFLSIIDDFSRYTFVYFLSEKGQVKEVFSEFQAMAEAQTGKKIKRIRTDNGTEFTNSQFQAKLKAAGIIHQTTMRYTPQQNGVAERANRVICEKARSMLQDASLPKSYWAEAVSTAVYLNNRAPTKAIVDKTPYEAWWSKKPNLSHLRIFGCRAMAQVPKELRKKWDPKSASYIFVGYCEESKGYRLIDPDTKKITTSRDVVFFESSSPQKVVKENEPEELASSTSIEVTTEDLEAVIEKPDSEKLDDNSSSSESFSSCTSEDEESPKKEPEIPRKSSRIPKPIKMLDYVTYMASSDEIEEPLTHEEALASPHAAEWKKAMDEELQSFVKNSTYEWTEVPPNKKPLKVKWVFKIKVNEDESPRFKARLVVKGYEQRAGIDYEEIFSPVIKYTSLRYLFALAVKRNLKIYHLDACTAYLHGNLDEEIFVIPPEIAQRDDKIWRLKKAVYGLKQSGRCWNQTLHRSLVNRQSFTQSEADPCIYYKCTEDDTIIIAVYVDDLLLFTNKDSLKTKVKRELESEFSMKDLGEAKHTLGMSITRDEASGKLWIDQSTYIAKILQRFNMAESRPVATPMERGQKEPENDENCAPNVPYQEAVGSLLYLCQISRPDICFSVNFVSKFCKNPKGSHWVRVKRIFRYLQSTQNFKLEYSKQGNENLECYSNSDWANDVKDRRSISGSCFKFMGGLISWSTKKQSTVALSTVESEYIALSYTAQEALWLKVLITEIESSSHKFPLIIFCDNMGAIHLAKNSITSQRSKHTDTRHHFIRSHVQNK